MEYEDIVPELLEKIKQDFQEHFNGSEKIAGLYAKVRDGTATYAEANEFAIEAGEILAGTFKRNLSSAVLPDGKMYFNIADRTVRPMMEGNYDLITDVTSQVQNRLNEDAGIGIKAIVPRLNEDRTDGIVNRVSSEELYDNVAWLLDEPIVNYCQSIVDDAIKTNAEFQYDAGLSPKIVRKTTGKCCEWCENVAGIYTYPKVPKDVYRRHQRCRCTVEYDPGTGKLQNVHTKKWVNDKERTTDASTESLFFRRNQIRKGEKYDGYSDITGEWYKDADYTTKKIVAVEMYTHEGILYKVDGKHVVLKNSKKELDVARLLIDSFGGEIELIPRILFPQNISTPDFIYKNQKYDLKNPEGISKNVLYNMVSKKKSQSTNFIFDTTECTLDMDEILRQVEGLYKSYHTRFVDVVVIVKNNKIEHVFKRK